MIHDFCIVGGGIVGLATARALLAARPGASLVLLEKEAALGRHQTGHNSGVIHSGIYYAPGSLKARLCREGAARTKDFCRAHAIPVEERGKLIVATRADEVPRLDALHARAVENGVRASLVDAAGIAEREPAIRGLKAISVPDAAIVDYRRVLQSLAEDLAAEGAEIRFGMAPDSIVETGDAVTVRCGDMQLRARHLVACAGLQSDRIARMAGSAIST